MLEQFLNHLALIGPVKKSDRFLLAVSGGVDSMVMLDLFTRAGLAVGVAHCNFQLRPGEAKLEEELVLDTCREKGVPVFTENFATSDYARQHKISIQVAARQLRYEFFRRVAGENDYNWVATAHHLNDSIETTLLNLVRGTGIEGLTGVPLINDRTIRPLLFTTREAIESYAKENNIQFRHDSSNFSDDYARNLVRNQVIPLLKEINPGLEDTFAATLQRLKESHTILNKTIQQISSQVISRDAGRVLFLKDGILKSGAASLVLWELLKQFDFNFDQCKRIVLTTQPGRWFFSRTHSVLNDRSHYILQPNTGRDTDSCAIGNDVSMVVMNDEVLEIEDYPAEGLVIANDLSMAFVDSDQLRFPITWRYWKAGDIFTPLGMSHQKKISDFLIDNKVNRMAKQDVSVLESGGEIIWVVGLRISDHLKVTGATKRVTVFRWVRTGRREA